jgi:predicted YcjX-like family ATPase
MCWAPSASARPAGWPRLLGARRVERILFAATKADHLHHEQHPALTAITEALLAEAKGRAIMPGPRWRRCRWPGCAPPSKRWSTATARACRRCAGGSLETGRQAVMYPGALPRDPARILSPAREGAERWLDAEYGLMAFAPARVMALKPGEGPPHIRLDRAAEFLIGDRL